MNTPNTLLTLVNALATCGFTFSLKDLEEIRNNDILESNKFIEKTEAKIDSMANKTIKVIAPIIDLASDHFLPDPSFYLECAPATEVDYHFDITEFQKRLDGIRKCVDFVAFKYKMGSPIITAVLIADNLEYGDRKRIFAEFDKTILSLRDMAASAKAGFVSFQSGATGIVLWCFCKGSEADSFVKTQQNELKRLHVLKLTTSLSWSLNLEDTILSLHHGPPWSCDAWFDKKAFLEGLQVC